MDSPVVAVVGSQSAGKSSVLESMINLDLLPKSAGLCTRVPLELTLINDSTLSYCHGSFSHLSDDGNKKFQTLDDKTNLHNIREEIARRTDELANPNQILDKPIFLVVRSPKVTNLRLIDLPGVTKISTAGQNTEIVKVISNLVRKYIKPSKTVILAVTPANMDLANSDSLGLAREVDPEGSRTIGVLTKIDLMDKGTDCIDVLENRTHSLHFGYIGVINRSQHDLQQKISLEKAKEKEKEFFVSSSTYSHLADRLGSRYLTSFVSEILVERIRREIPVLKKELVEARNDISIAIEKSGLADCEMDERKSREMVLNIIKLYCENIQDSLEGTKKDRVSLSQQNLEKKIKEDRESMKKKLSLNYSCRKADTIKIKKNMMYHSRYVVTNNGVLTWYKAQNNLANPKSLDLSLYDCVQTEEKEVLQLKSEKELILLKLKNESEKEEWLKAIQKGREFLKSTGKTVYVTEVKEKKEPKKKKSEVKTLSEISKELLNQKGSKSAGSVIKLTYLLEFIPEIEKENSIDKMLADAVMTENASGYHFLDEKMGMPFVFVNFIHIVIEKLRDIANKWLEKVESVFRDLAMDCLPEDLIKFQSLQNFILGITSKKIRTHVEEIKKDVKYEFKLNANNINGNNKFFLRDIPENPTVAEYLKTYIMTFKVHIVDLIWKYIMAILIKKIKSELRDKLNMEVYSISYDQLKSMMEIDPSEVIRIKNMKKSLKEVNEAIEKLVLINI